MSSPAITTDRIGPYELLEPLGAGGFARVYRVRRGSAELAAKVLAPGAPSTDPAALLRFEREIRVLEAIKHPNLIELVDHGVDPAHGPYLVTRLVVGMTLRDLAAGHALCPEAALLLVEPALRALGAMHAVGLVHRDVKPENVMVTPLGDVVLVDLGLAIDGASSRLTEAGAVTGSVPYMSPEQIEGDAITPASDLWAVGVMLYELVAGRRPFQRERSGEELASILAARFEPLSTVERRVGEELDAFVRRCLARDPGARFPDASTALEALSACIDWVTPRQMREERAAVMSDPRGYAARATDRRVRLACDEARAHLAAGQDFEALRVLDRALSYRPDDPTVLALVARASGGEPVEDAADVTGTDATVTAKGAEAAGTLYDALRVATAPIPTLAASTAAHPRRSRRGLAGAGLVVAGVALGALATALLSVERSPEVAASEALASEAAALDDTVLDHSALSDDTALDDPAPSDDTALDDPAPSDDSAALDDSALALSPLVPSSPLPPLPPARALTDARPLDPATLANDDPPRGFTDVAAPGAPLVPVGAFGAPGPEGALATLDAQLAERPGSPDLLVGRALALLGSGRTGEGLAELERLGRAHPDLPMVWGARGYVAYRQRRHDEAERFLSRAIELDPTNATDWRNRGLLRSKRGRTRDAYIDLTTALRYRPDDVEALTELAGIYDRAERRADARPLLERVVRLRPQHVQAWVDLSMTQSDPDEALASVRRALALAPSYARAHVRLCRLLAQRSATEAIAACTRAAELDARDSGVRMNRGLAHYHLGDTTAALRDLDAAIALDPRAPINFTNRYLVRLHAGDTDGARQDLQHACELGHEPACEELGRAVRPAP